jgi:hypothetical protein
MSVIRITGTIVSVSLLVHCSLTSPLFAQDPTSRVLRDESGYQSRLIVRPIGSPEENGDALLRTVNRSRPTSQQPILVKVLPGIYDLVWGSLVMKPHLDLEGSGIGTTIVTGLGTYDEAVLQGASESEVRNLTIESRSVAGESNAVLNRGSAPRFRNMLAVARGRGAIAFRNIDTQVDMSEVEGRAIGSEEGGGAYGIRNEHDSGRVVNSVFYSETQAFSTAVLVDDESSTVFRNVEAYAKNGVVNEGVIVSWRSSPEFHNLEVTVDGRAKSHSINRGMSLIGSPSRPVVSFSRIRVMGGHDSSNRGIYNNGSNSTIRSVDVEVEGGGEAISIGAYNVSGGMTTYTDVQVVAKGGGETLGMWFSAPPGGLIRINRSLVEGHTASFLNYQGYDVVIGGSQIIGPVDDREGSQFTCVDSYDETLQSLPTSCYW